jgi:hypothetical protein
MTLKGVISGDTKKPIYDRSASPREAVIFTTAAVWRTGRTLLYAP